ncbi:MAG: hypothetical protein WKH97_03305 [Casimicrobiaceae bacterium]
MAIGVYPQLVTAGKPTIIANFFNTGKASVTNTARLFPSYAKRPLLSRNHNPEAMTDNETAAAMITASTKLFQFIHRRSKAAA